MYQTLSIVFAALFIVLTLAAVLMRGKRGVLVWGALAALVAGLAAYWHVFWLMSLATLTIPWALICAGDWVDMSWRFRVGFCAFLGFGSILAIYPTYVDEHRDQPDLDRSATSEMQSLVDAEAREGKMGFGRFIRANIPFRLVRGLDLKGGARFVYNVDVQEAIKDKRDRYYDELRGALSQSFGHTPEGEQPTNEQLSKLDGVVRIDKVKEDVAKLIVSFTNAEDSAKVNDAFLKRFIGEMSVLRAADRKTITFRIKQEVEHSVRDSAVAQAKDKVHRRIDALGVKEATVSSRDEDIIIEVPGNDQRQFDEIREIISQTARLEFKMVEDDVDFFETIAKDTKAEDLPEGLRFEIENAPVGVGKSKPNHYAVLIKKPEESMRDALKRFQDWAATLNVPDTHQISFSKRLDYNEDKELFEEVGWRSYYLYSRAEIVGDMIREATAQPDQSPSGVGQWVVSMVFSPIGADRFENVTARNIQRRFAIILDDRVESAPVIQGKISGGSGQITMGAGNPQQQLEDAKKLELVLKSGALPAPISMSNQQLIGPSLGSDAIEQGVKGAAIGGGGVLLLMLILYSRAGFVANIAVLFNLVLQVAALAMFNASMTLPGIAALALTIGIAVDANVLINERIRDELRAGKSARAAVDVGYDRAFTAIFDGHVTTLISGLILFQYGTGPIKGFAVTLMIGVAVSLFTGVICTRLMFDYTVRWRKVKKLSLG